MGRLRTTDRLMERIADALLELLRERPLDEIIVDEITDRAGVGRATYFRSFTSKREVITFKFVRLWERFAEEKDIKERRKFDLNNVELFFAYNYGIRDTLRTVYRAGLEDAVFDSFTLIMLPPDADDLEAWYREKFYSYGLFGALDGWVRRDFAESPERMAEIVRKMF